MRKRSKAFSSAVAVALVLGGASLEGQFRGFQAASAVPSPPVEVKPGGTFAVPLTVRIRRGYHINSNKPLEDYLIPTQIVWDAAPFEVLGTEYPEAELVMYEFSESPLSVFSGEFTVKTKLKAPAKLPDAKELVGRMRYQACNDKACLAPTSFDVKIPLM